MCGGLFLGLSCFVQAVPAQQHTTHDGWSDPQWKEAGVETAGGKEPPKKDPTTIKAQLIKRTSIKSIKGILKVSSLGDQGGCTTESHKRPNNTK